MILVVSDTSAISALLQIGQIGILNQLYDEIVIPESVRDELLRAHADIPCFIGSHSVADSPALTARRQILDEGEACAITLAEQLNADLLLIDEKRGRAVAEQAGLRYIGLVGVLVEAKRRAIIPAIKPLLDRLIADAGFRLGMQLRTIVLSEANEL